MHILYMSILLSILFFNKYQLYNNITINQNRESIYQLNTIYSFNHSLTHSSLHLKNYKTYELEIWNSDSSNDLDFQ